MIFKSYREIINYILKYFPYEKIIIYCVENNYGWFIKDDRGKILDYRYPSVSDIKKKLLLGLSYMFNHFSKNDRTIDDIHVCKIYTCFHTDRPFRAYIRDSKIIINYVFSYEKNSRFHKYTVPFRGPYGDSKARVTFRFKEKII